MADTPITSGSVQAAMGDYNTLIAQKSGTDTMAAITQKYGSTVADAVRRTVAAGGAKPATAASSGPAQGAFGFSNISPSSINLMQGDAPAYIKPGPSNTILGATDQSTIAAGGSPDLVGWSYAKPATGLFSSLSHSIGTTMQGGLTYYSLSGFLEQWGSMDPATRTAIQKQLLASGMYAAASSAYYATPGSGVAKKSPLYGAAADPDTIAALKAAFDAARSTGQPVDAVLNQANAAAIGAAQMWQQNTMVGTFEQSSPDELRALADQNAVNILGRKATAEEKMLAVAMVQGHQIARQQGEFNQKVAAQRSDVAVQLAGGIGGASGGLPGSGSPATVNALVAALGGQESGSPTAGGYGAVNPDSGASGRFQIMPDNWPSWSQAAGLGANAAMTPQNQEIVARNQISIYLKNGGGDPAYVAVAWYAGEGSAKAFQADPTNPKWQKPQVSNGHSYPSIASYAQSIAGKMASAVPGSLATQSMAGQVGDLGGGGGTIGGPTTPTLAQAAAGGAADVSAGPGIGSPDAGGVIGGASGVPFAQGQSSKGGTVAFGPGLDTQGKPIPGALPQPTGAVSGAGGLPTPAQLVPTSTGIYTQSNPTDEIAAMLREKNPQGTGARDIANVLDAVHALFRQGS